MPRANLRNHNLPRAEIDQRHARRAFGLNLIIRLFILGHA
jgi:hypothetical protein